MTHFSGSRSPPSRLGCLAPGLPWPLPRVEVRKALVENRRLPSWGWGSRTCGTTTATPARLRCIRCRGGCDGVSMETRAMISCTLMCWKAKSKRRWEGGSRVWWAIRPPWGASSLKYRGEEGRRIFRYPELTCCLPEAQSVAGSKGQPWQRAWGRDSIHTYGCLVRRVFLLWRGLLSSA